MGCSQNYGPLVVIGYIYISLSLSLLGHLIFRGTKTRPLNPKFGNYPKAETEVEPAFAGDVIRSAQGVCAASGLGTRFRSEGRGYIGVIYGFRGRF